VGRVSGAEVKCVDRFPARAQDPPHRGCRSAARFRAGWGQNPSGRFLFPRATSTATNCDAGNCDAGICDVAAVEWLGELFFPPGPVGSGGEQLAAE
jgi:hypothetical protein